MKKVVLFSIFIISLLSALVIPNLFGKIVCTKQSFLTGQLKTVSLALNLYKSDHGVFPVGLDKLVSNSELGPYLPSLPKDPWDRFLVYKVNKTKDSFKIISYGADGIFGGKGENRDRIMKSP